MKHVIANTTNECSILGLRLNKKQKQTQNIITHIVLFLSAIVVNKILSITSYKQTNRHWFFFNVFNSGQP